MEKSRRFFFPLLLLPGLISCGQNPSPKQVLLDMGNLASYQVDAAYTKEEAYTPIALSKLRSLQKEEANFVFLVRGSSDTCACWHAFLKNCLGPYVRAKHLLVYEMDLATFESSGNSLGIPLYEGYDSIAIFEAGKMVHAKTNAEDERFGYDQATFNQWMDERLIAPKVYRISQDQLDRLYNGIDPFGAPTSRFALLFGRATCPDCSFLLRYDMKEYFAKRESASLPLYYFDADPWREKEDYASLCLRYGLTKTEENPYAYEGGRYPTLLSVIPNGGEKIKTIDQIGVFYNDSIENGAIARSYFSKARLDDPATGLNGALSYVSSVSPHSLEGLEVDVAKSKNEALKPYHQPLFNALMDEIL